LPCGVSAWANWIDAVDAGPACAAISGLTDIATPIRAATAAGRVNGAEMAFKQVKDGMMVSSPDFRPLGFGRANVFGVDDKNSRIRSLHRSATSDRRYENARLHGHGATRFFGVAPNENDPVVPLVFQPKPLSYCQPELSGQTRKILRQRPA
jgi:hypothetical protein